jgi:hypothetical protein
MKRLVIIAIIKMLAKATFFTALAGFVIGVIGYVKKWDNSLANSNSFFLAGILLIIAGASSRMGAGQEWSAFLMCIRISVFVSKMF